jgi:predicted kinase
MPIFTDVFSTDSIIEKWAKDQNKTYTEIFSDSIQEAENVFWQQVEEAMVKGNDNIVIDRTNLTEKGRKKWFTLASKYDYIVNAFLFLESKNTLEKRNIERNKKTGKYIPDNIFHSIFHRMYHSFEPPKYSEGFGYINYVG